ncbi:hypothetical protein BJ878DRAFT_237632 [Calycina marina]|uniref:Uncharacterized protein n=1 Tax=Calycina marina TaxID=1763456 RepID=A0A9P7ZBS7_9HELO|nr:hypothetical protein BJ878DRAFT_237632 [Calycina marina]
MPGPAPAGFVTMGHGGTPPGAAGGNIPRPPPHGAQAPHFQMPAGNLKEQKQPGPQSINKPIVSDLTPKPKDFLSTDADYRKALATIDAYTIRKIQSADPKKDTSTWAKVEFSKEHVTPEEVSRQVKRLSESRKGSVSERRQALMSWQSRQVDKLMEFLNNQEDGEHFEWTLVQLAQTIKRQKNGHKKETTAITCYCKRGIRSKFDPKAVYTITEKIKQDMTKRMSAPPFPQQGMGQPPPPPPPPPSGAFLEGRGGGPRPPPPSGAFLEGRGGGPRPPPPSGTLLEGRGGGPRPPPPSGTLLEGRGGGPRPPPPILPGARVLGENKGRRDKGHGRGEDSDSESDGRQKSHVRKAKAHTRKGRGQKPQSESDSSFEDSDSNSDGASDYSSSLNTSISSRPDHHNRREGRPNNRRRSRRSKSHVRGHSRARLSPYGGRYIQDRMAPEPVLVGPYSPYGPRPAYVPEVPRVTPDYEQVAAAAYQAGKMDADAQRNEAVRAHIVRPIQAVESPREMVSHIRPYDHPVVQHYHPGRHERQLAELRFVDDRYVDEIRIRDDQRYRDEELRWANARRRRESENYIDARIATEPRVVYHRPHSPHPFAPRSYSPSFDSYRHGH